MVVIWGGRVAVGGSVDRWPQWLGVINEKVSATVKGGWSGGFSSGQRWS